MGWGFLLDCVAMTAEEPSGRTLRRGRGLERSGEDACAKERQRNRDTVEREVWSWMVRPAMPSGKAGAWWLRPGLAGSRLGE